MGLERYDESERSELLRVFHDEIQPADGLRALYPQHYRTHLSEHHPESLELFDACVGALPPQPMDFVPLRQALTATVLTALTTQQGTSLEEDIVRFSDVVFARFQRDAAGQVFARVAGGNLIALLSSVAQIIPTLYNRGSGRVEAWGEDAVQILVEDLSGAHIVHLVWRGTAERLMQKGFQVASRKLSPECFELSVQRNKG